jgi:hypothetical protein
MIIIDVKNHESLAVQARGWLAKLAWAFAPGKVRKEVEDGMAKEIQANLKNKKVDATVTVGTIKKGQEVLVPLPEQSPAEGSSFSGGSVALAGVAILGLIVLFQRRPGR